MTKLLAALLLLVACKDDRAPDPRVLGLGGAPHVAAPAGESPSCAKLVAPIAGFTLNERKLPNNTTRCSYKKPGSFIDVTAHCSDQMIATYPTVRAMFKNATELPGLGRGAYQLMGGIVQFWDDDTNCMVTIGAMGADAPKDIVAFAHEVAASITPASLE